MKTQSLVKHTPGPWKVSIHSENEVLNVTYKLFQNPTSLGEVHANVDLIATAPDLLYYLKIEHGQKHMSKCDICDAIAKAEGK